MKRLAEPLIEILAELDAPMETRNASVAPEEFTPVPAMIDPSAETPTASESDCQPLIETLCVCSSHVCKESAPDSGVQTKAAIPAAVKPRPTMMFPSAEMPDGR